MRVALHWRGKPLIAVDLTAATPEAESTDQGPLLQASASLQDSARAEPMQPDTTTFGFGARPEALR